MEITEVTFIFSTSCIPREGHGGGGINGRIQMLQAKALYCFESDLHCGNVLLHAFILKHSLLSTFSQYTLFSDSWQFLVKTNKMTKQLKKLCAILEEATACIYNCFTICSTVIERDWGLPALPRSMILESLEEFVNLKVKFLSLREENI